ncbi:MAG: prephenate dehydrogenase [Planctomycetia bacterium]|nr:prephenate dehydrogenase [Planctomycetia bacterium]
MSVPSTITIIGTGLLGASLGKGLLSRGVVRKVVGVGRSRANLETALACGCITEIEQEPARAVLESSLVVVCTPVGAIVEKVREVVLGAPSGAIFTDVGSTKASLVRELRGLPNGGIFVGGHPIAGKEATGAAAADADLFEGKLTILTPDEGVPVGAVATVREMWESLGSRVICMGAEAHDRELARTSHFPHALSSLLSGLVGPEEHGLCGTGFRSMTRLAGSSVPVWRDILWDNRDNVLAVLAEYQEQLIRLQNALSADDAEALEAILLLAKKNRDALGS